MKKEKIEIWNRSNILSPFYFFTFSPFYGGGLPCPSKGFNLTRPQVSVFFFIIAYTLIQLNIHIFTYRPLLLNWPTHKDKLDKRKRTNTYGIAGWEMPLRQGRSLSLPTLPFQKTNRYAVVNKIAISYIQAIASCLLPPRLHDSHYTQTLSSSLPIFAQ